MGIVHGDIKQANMMTDGAGNIKLIDFNAASKLGEYRDYSIGSALYQSPLAHNISISLDNYNFSIHDLSQCKRIYDNINSYTPVPP